MDKEKQEFQLGDIAYMMDDDFHFFESEVFRIALRNGKFEYETHDCDFTNNDIWDWVFKSSQDRAISSEIKFC